MNHKISGNFDRTGNDVVQELPPPLNCINSKMYSGIQKTSFRGDLKSLINLKKVTTVRLFVCRYS